MAQIASTIVFVLPYLVILDTETNQDKTNHRIISHNVIVHSVSTNNMTRYVLSDTRLDPSLENLTSLQGHHDYTFS